MHEGQLSLDEARARELIRVRFPELAGRPLRRVHAAGTVNAIFRIGDDLVARLPLLGVTVEEVTAEAEGLAELADASPFPAPRPIGVGEPTPAYPSAWSVQSWIPGDPASHDRHAASASLAQDVAALIRALRAAPVGDRLFDGRGRGGRLSDHDEWLAVCFENSAGMLDVERARRLWGALRELPAAGPDVMSHRDLTPPNLLVRGDRLTGVLDGGGFGPADRALDLVSAWHLFDAPARRVVRDELAIGDVEWLRGAAWALQQAMGLGWYYAESNPAMSLLGLSTMRRLLDDEELSDLT